MAKNGIEQQLDQLDGETVQEAEADAYVPLYRVYPNSKIPVSKALGPFWENRMREGAAALKNTGVHDRWEEVIRYYQNDQGGQSNRKGRLAEVATGSSNEKKYATENIVFANISALVPSIYAKNPDVEISFTTPQQEKQAAMFEALVDKLITGKVAPCVSLKPKMRRLTVLGMLTNLGYFDLSYVKKEDSSDAALQEIMKLSEELQKAKNVRDIAEIEGKLQALDDKVNLLATSGPRLRVRPPQSVIVDPNSEEVDLSDATYIIVEDYLRTEFLRAVYGEKDPETGEWKSTFDPTHVIKADSKNTDMQGHDEEINHFTLIDTEADYKKYGYDDEASYKNAQRTKVWMVWDKTTRRVIMFHDKNWKMPIWVWDDPYHLTRFFNIYPLAFYTDPVQRYARSEVMYYLDQQDELNTIANEKARMRHWAMSKVFVNTTVIKDVTAVQNFLSGATKDLVFGVSLPEGAKLSDAIGTMPSPSTQYEGLFDSQPILQTINRLSSVTPILQNEQFKTNTTNKAIESYESSTQTRLDEKIDAIEDLLADIGVGLIEMCIQFMTEDDVIALIGRDIVEAAGGWPVDMTPDRFHREFQFRVVGGSTLKPTSKVKKEQAINLMQTLGQFASGTPAVLFVALKALHRAFADDVVILPEEWDLITQSIMQAISGQGQAAPSANGGGRPPSSGGGNADGDIVAAGAEAIGAIVDKLPPELKAQVGELIAQGVPLKQIIAQLAQA